MHNPLVSIIIPTYNRAHLIGETLDSVLAQTYQNWECIIIDDGSTDNSEEVILGYVKKEPKFKYHKRPVNRPKGANSCRNYGFELSKGEYVNWFDDDDVMDKEKIRIQIQVLKNSSFNFSVCQTLIFQNNVNNVIGIRHKRISSNNPLYDFITHQIVFLTSSPLFKKKFLTNTMLKFDEELQAAQEWEFICRVFCYSTYYHSENKALVYNRMHNNSISHNNNIWYRKWNYFLARKKIYYFLKKNNHNINSEIVNYFKSYFSVYFMEILFQRNSITALKVFFSTIIKFHSFIMNIKIFIVMTFILITGKGYRFRNLLK